jgi:hypothetical protein
VKRFSEREGYKSIKEKIQIESIDDDLRNSLWNLLCKNYFTFSSKPMLYNQLYVAKLDDNVKPLFDFIWISLFKKPIDEMGGLIGSIYDKIKKYYFNCDWYEVYDFIEFIANNNIHHYLIKRGYRTINEVFIKECNEILERETSGYRFVHNIITRITSKIEIKEIEESFERISNIPNVNLHLNQALVLISSRKNPDYRNSIKESISAVEALCKIISKNDKATLGDALKIVKEKIGLHPALENSFSDLYGYTSSADGIRHALLEETNLNFDDAKFFLVSCSAFINYLISKCNLLGIVLIS